MAAFKVVILPRFSVINECRICPEQNFFPLHVWFLIFEFLEIEKMQKKVMIVDDDDDIRKYVSDILSREGHDILTASSGKECLEKVEGGFKGVVLMDVMMPEMNGWEVIKELVKRKLLNDVIICILTVKDHPDPAMDEVKEFVLDYIRKPFDPQKLVELVRQYIGYLK